MFTKSTGPLLLQQPSLYYTMRHTRRSLLAVQLCPCRISTSDYTSRHGTSLRAKGADGDQVRTYLFRRHTFWDSKWHIQRVFSYSWTLTLSQSSSQFLHLVLCHECLLWQELEIPVSSIIQRGVTRQEVRFLNSRYCSLIVFYKRVSY